MIISTLTTAKTLLTVGHATHLSPGVSLTLADWVGIGTGLATLILAVFTAWMALQAKRSADETHHLADATKAMAEATQEAVTIEQKSLIQSQDALMPVLELHIRSGESLLRPDGKPDREFIFATLRLENHGPGPAFIREFTMREEVDWFDIFTSPLRHAVVASHGAVELPLKFRPNNRLPQQECVSSFSVWYDDVYGHHYRSRVVFTYASKKDPNREREWRAITKLGYTFQRNEVAAPSFTYNSPLPTKQLVWLQEGGRVIPAAGRNPAWYRLNAVKDVSTDWQDGVPVTNQQRFRLVDWTFWLSDSRPQITLEVEGHAPFVLAIDPSQVQHAPTAPDKWIRLCPADAIPNFNADLHGELLNPQKAPLSKWGLRDQSTLSSDLLSLYTDVTALIDRQLTLVKPQESGDPDKLMPDAEETP